MDKLTNQLQSAKQSLKELATQRDEVALLHQESTSINEQLHRDLNSEREKLLDLEAKLNEKTKNFEELQKNLTLLQVELKDINEQYKVG